jgi:signal transduction histidine kinase/CheY-like chemotaxis protein
MSEPALLADHLDEHTDTILAVWRATVERVGDVPEAERLSYREFIDHVPELLDRLAERLRGRPVDAGAEGKMHGTHRWRQGYDIGEIVCEFAHLRTALCRATIEYARTQHWDVNRLETAYEVINEVLAEATAESVRQFQEDSRAEAQRREEELRRQRELADEGSQHKTRLISTLSHDIRTPLSAVVMAAQFLEIHFEGAGAAEADVEVQESLRTIRHSVRNVLDLLSDLLDLSKIEAGAAPPEVALFPIEPVLAECLSSIETQARMKGLEIRLEAGGLAGASLRTDRAKLKQIVANFLSNAVRYTEQGQIHLSTGQRDGHVLLSVADTGVGIAAEDQERIFDEFAVVGNSRRSHGEGTGLGLAICRRLAGLLGGAINLDSTPGRGSTFSLVLPDSVLVPGRAEPVRGEVPALPGGETGAILVAEDHNASRQTMARVLRRFGYRVLEACNGREALDLIEAEAGRLFAVLMDVNMPIMDGVTATLALRADTRFRDIPIFALTGDVTRDNQQRIGTAGVNGYIEKPVTLEVLRQALASLGHPTPEPRSRPAPQ